MEYEYSHYTRHGDQYRIERCLSHNKLLNMATYCSDNDDDDDVDFNDDVSNDDNDDDSDNNNDDR